MSEEKRITKLNLLSGYQVTVPTNLALEQIMDNYDQGDLFDFEGMECYFIVASYSDEEDQTYIELKATERELAKHK